MGSFTSFQDQKHRPSAASLSSLAQPVRPFVLVPAPTFQPVSLDRAAYSEHARHFGHSLDQIPIFPPELHMSALSDEGHSMPVQKNTSGLPDNLKASAENLSGLSMDDVEVHYHSSKPAQVLASAYTQGKDIYVGPNQERHLAHEAWHVVQQKQGRVQPRLQLKGSTISDDPVLEHEADVMGERTTREVYPGQRASLQHQTLNRVSGYSNIGGQIIQRAITIGENALPRNTASNQQEFLDLLKEQGDKMQGNGEEVVKKFKELHDARDITYIFSSFDHMFAYLMQETGYKFSNGVQDPLKVRVPATELSQAHRNASDTRFTNIYQPGPNQIPISGPGAHNIPPAMLPPPGDQHSWQISTLPTGNPHLALYENKLTSPIPSTPRTFGDPQKPSLLMHQGGLNLGMHIQPTNNSVFLDPIKRNETTYGGIALGPSGSGRVRGHPLLLKQGQRSTDDKTTTFDNYREGYTDEADSTKPTGGVSTYRANEIEKRSVENNTPFTQVNQNSTVGGLGIAKPDNIYFRFEKSAPGTHDDILIDNTGVTDYRNVPLPPGVKRQKNQTEMGRNAANITPYPLPSVHMMGEDFDEPQKSSYPGYMTPPPTPFLTTSFSPPFVVTLAGTLHVGGRLTLPDGRDCLVVKILNINGGNTTCELQEIPKTQWPASATTLGDTMDIEEYGTMIK